MINYRRQKTEDRRQKTEDRRQKGNFLSFYRNRKQIVPCVSLLKLKSLKMYCALSGIENVIIVDIREGEKI